jgi:hypothetical protein
MRVLGLEPRTYGLKGRGEGSGAAENGDLPNLGAGLGASSAAQLSLVAAFLCLLVKSIKTGLPPLIPEIRQPRQPAGLVLHRSVRVPVQRHDRGRVPQNRPLYVRVDAGLH